MAYKEDITADMARQLLSYEPGTGELRWRVRHLSMFHDGKKFDAKHAMAKWNTRYAGQIAGRIGDGGYYIVMKNRKPYRAHRLIWLMVHGFWPSGEIDHKNGVRHENWLLNLRDGTRAQNHQNLEARTELGLLGARWNEKRQKWRSRITVNRRDTSLGYHDTEKQAHEAYLEAKKRLHTFQPVPRGG